MKSIIIAAALALIVSACGGGGGGAGPNVKKTTYYQTPQAIGTYDPVVGNSTNFPVMDIYAKDLNKDNEDEVVVGGRAAKHSTADFNMQIFGWNTGSFTNETSTWFNAGENVINGTEPSVKFADFNGDGYVDMFVAHSMDTKDNKSTSTIFVNNAADDGMAKFTKVTPTSAPNVWSHDSAVYDLNGNGRSEIIALDYYDDNGTSGDTSDDNPADIVIHYYDGTTFKTSAAVNIGASGIVIGNFDGDADKEIVLTDANGQGINKVYDYSFDATAGTFSLTEISGSTIPNSTQNHAIRSVAMDLNGDGKDDLLIFSRPLGGSSTSSVQVMINDGTGKFTDETSSRLSGYNGDEAGVNYQPVIMDVNNDGKDDIFLSGADFNGDYNSTQVLVQTSDGKFVSKYASTFTQFWNEIEGMTANSNEAGQAIQIVKGPGGDYYLVSNVLYESGGDYKAKLFLAKIGKINTISAQTMTQIIQEAWPYVEGSRVLALTSPGTVNGMQIADLQAALLPYGNLGIALDGRLGTKILLNGHLAAPGLEINFLDKVSAVDDIGREFKVDLRVLGHKQEYNVASAFNVTSVNQTWAANLAGKGNSYINRYVTAASDNEGNQFTSFGNIGLSVNSSWHYRIGTGTFDHNPWMSMSGVFGTIKSTTVIDATIGYVNQSGTWAQFGMSQTHTNLKPGIVQEVTPLSAVYATAGKLFNKNQSAVYIGLAPYLIDGSMKMKVPTNVELDGTMTYTNYNKDLRNDAVGFVGVDHTMNFSNNKVHNLNSKAVVDSTGEYSVNINYNFQFK